MRVDCCAAVLICPHRPSSPLWNGKWRMSIPIYRCRMRSHPLTNLCKHCKRFRIDSSASIWSNVQKIIPAFGNNIREILQDDWRGFEIMIVTGISPRSIECHAGLPRTIKHCIWDRIFWRRIITWQSPTIVHKNSWL